MGEDVFKSYLPEKLKGKYYFERLFRGYEGGVHKFIYLMALLSMREDIANCMC